MKKLFENDVCILSGPTRPTSEVFPLISTVMWSSRCRMQNESSTCSKDTVQHARSGSWAIPSMCITSYTAHILSCILLRIHHALRTSSMHSAHHALHCILISHLASRITVVLIGQQHGRRVAVGSLLVILLRRPLSSIHERPRKRHSKRDVIRAPCPLEALRRRGFIVDGPITPTPGQPPRVASPRHPVG